MTNLTLDVTTPAGPARILDDVTLTVQPGQAVALVGESGSGKSTVGLSALQLLDAPPFVRRRGSVRLQGVDWTLASEAQRSRLRGRHVAMVFQDPMTSLTPTMTVGAQLDEVLRHHRNWTARQARAASVAMLAQVGLADPAAAARAFPHTFSGGMRQRVVLAMALLGEPALLVADEPTTALDVTVQAQILALLRRETARRNMATLLISHDLGVVAGIADRINVMYAGRIVEQASAQALFQGPRHPYTATLLQAARNLAEPLPEATGPLQAAQTAPAKSAALRVACLQVSYPSAPCWPWQRPGRRTVVQNASLQVARGEVLALVGESGSGKSTLARAILQLLPSDAGEIWLGESPLHALWPRPRWWRVARRPNAQMRPLRRHLQAVFQDPQASLDGRQTVWQTLEEPLWLHHAQGQHPSTRRALATALLAEVGLDATLGPRLPHALSGGQRQRLALARALAPNPQVLVADEPTSALDVGVKAQVLALLRRLTQQRQLATLFVSHDLAAVRAVAQRTAVMLGGQLVEVGPTQKVTQAPLHPYTQALLAAEPVADPTLQRARLVDLADNLQLVDNRARSAGGCPYQPRCPLRTARCSQEVPALQAAGAHHAVACFAVQSQPRGERLATIGHTNG